MSKMILYGLIILLCGLAGIIKAQNYSLRIELLTDLINVFRILENEMRYRLDPLPDTLIRVGSYKQNKACGLLLETGDRLKMSRASFGEYWCEAIDDIYGRSALLYEDILIIKDMGIEFGKSGLHGQNSMFTMANIRLSEQLSIAVEENKTKGKLFRSIGFAIGITIVILLI